MARGKGTRGRGARGGSTTRSTRSSQDTEDLLASGVLEKDLASAKRTKETNEGAGGEGTLAKKRKQDEEAEDWGLEGKSFWKGTVPQSVDTNCYVLNQLPPPNEAKHVGRSILRLNIVPPQA